MLHSLARGVLPSSVDTVTSCVDTVTSQYDEDLGILERL
jgi:hypothetical protein